MGSQNPDEELSARLQSSFEALSAEDKAACLLFLPVRDEFSSYLSSAGESQGSSDTSSDGYTSSQPASDSSASSSGTNVDLQQHQEDPFTAEILAQQLENSIEAVQTDSDTQSQSTNDVCDVPASQTSLVPGVAPFDFDWHGQEVADVLERHGLSHGANAQLSADDAELERWKDAMGMPRDAYTLPSVVVGDARSNIETSLYQSPSAFELAPSGDYIQSQPCAKDEASVDQAPTTPASQTVDVTTRHYSECAIDSSDLGGSFQNEPHAATSAPSWIFDQQPTASLPPASEAVDVAVAYRSESANDSVASASLPQNEIDAVEAIAAMLPSVSETLHVDVDTAYHSGSVNNWIVPSSASVQNEPYTDTSTAQRDVDQGLLTIHHSGSDTADLANTYDSGSAIRSVTSVVQSVPYPATSTAQGYVDQASTAILSSAVETIDSAAYPSVGSFDPVASGYYNQSALSSHQNTANYYHTSAYYPTPHASSDPIYSQAAIPRSQVPQPINSWDNTSIGTFQRYGVTSMVPQGSDRMQMRYPSMGLATGEGLGAQQYAQTAGLHHHNPIYPTSSAVGVAAAASQSAFVDYALTQRGTLASTSTVSPYRGQQIHIPVPCPVSHSQMIARNTQRSQMQRSNTMPYSQDPNTFPPHWSFSQAHAARSFASATPSAPSSRELLPDNDTNVPCISGAIRTKDGKKGKGKAKVKPYTPKPTPTLRRTQSDTPATRFHQWDISQLNRKQSCTPESDASGSSSSSMRGGETMPRPVKCLWEGCEGPSFTDRHALRRHIHTHTGPSSKDYMKCLWNGCDTDEMQADSVVRHILTCHARPDGIPCNLCGVKCSRNDASLRHRQEVCKYCAVCRVKFPTVAERVIHEKQCTRF